jgi:hypothetical protein
MSGVSHRSDHQPIVRRVWARIRERPFESLFAAAVGLFCSWAVLQSFVGHSGWTLGLAPLVAIVVGGTLLPVLVSPMALPDKLARAYAEFWETGAGTRALVRASVYGCISIAWGIALVTVLGVRPAVR